MNNRHGPDANLKNGKIFSMMNFMEKYYNDIKEVHGITPGYKIDEKLSYEVPSV